MQLYITTVYIPGTSVLHVSHSSLKNYYIISPLRSLLIKVLHQDI